MKDEHQYESVTRISETHRLITKIANKPSTRQRQLVARKTLNVPLKENEIDRGEDLKRGYRK